MLGERSKHWSEISAADFLFQGKSNAVISSDIILKFFIFCE